MTRGALGATKEKGALLTVSILPEGCDKSAGLSLLGKKSIDSMPVYGFRFQLTSAQ